MAIIKGKKGFMFTLVTIFLISIFVFILYSRSSNVIMDQRQATAERTEAVVMNLFTQTLTEEYMDAIVKAASANALQAMLVYVNETRTEIPEPEEFFTEIVVNGTGKTAGTYGITDVSKDFAMTLTVINDSREILITTEETATEEFGAEQYLTQEISSTSLGPLERLFKISLSITNNSAESGDIYLMVYNESDVSLTGTLVSLDHQVFSTANGNPQLMTFDITGRLALTPDKHYYIVLAAPFAGETPAFTVSTAAESAYTCESYSCNAQKWTNGGTDASLIFPFDFSLSHTVIGKGFLRALMGSFESLGKEKMNIDTIINLTTITVEGSPWEIDVNGTFLISTEKTTVSFSDIYSEGIGTVSIVGMYDPLSMLNYNEGILTEERQYLRIAAQNVSDDFDEEDMFLHLEGQTFVFNENAPSYLQRFAGQSAGSSTCCGIQTVYLDSDITVADDADKEYSYVDHMFQDSPQCAEDNPLYQIISALDDLSFFTGSASPLFDYTSIEFYHLDEMSGVTVGQASCPTT